MGKSKKRMVSLFTDLKTVQVDRPISNTDHGVYMSLQKEKYLVGIDLDRNGLNLALYIYKQDNFTGRYNRIADIIPQATNEKGFKIRVTDLVDELEPIENISIHSQKKPMKCYGNTLDIYVY